MFKDRAEKILELLGEKTKLSQKITLDWLSSEAGQIKLANLCRAIDFEVAQLMMDWIPKDKWHKLARIASKVEPDPSVIKEFIQAVTTLDLVWEDNYQNLNDPFQDLSKLKKSELLTLVDKFTAEEWALTSAFWEKPRLLDFAKNFQPNKKRAFILAVERLKRIPKESLTATASSFANRVNLNLSENKPNRKVVDEYFTMVKSGGESVAEAIEAFVELSKKEKTLDHHVIESLGNIDKNLGDRLKEILLDTNEQPADDRTSELSE